MSDQTIQADTGPKGEARKDKGPKGFTLVSGDDGMVGPTELGKLIELRTKEKAPTAQTIRNHAAKGTLTGTKDPDQGWRFSRATAVDQWIDNRKPPKHGGKRRGAGKSKDATRPSQTLTGPVTDGYAARSAIAARMALDDQGNLGPPPANAVLVTDVMMFTRAEVKALIIFNCHDGLLTTNHLSKLEKFQDLKFKDQKLAEKNGELVKASDIADAWSVEQSRIVNQVLSVPAKIAGRLSTAAWPSDETTSAICKLLHEEGVESDTVTIIGQMLAKPADLEGRFRMIIDAMVGKMMSEVAGPPGIGD
ncbi:hypothetical protein COB72_09315 [bacterium]|nr:MAG: hypothetical protein COB72_09315 [bacterium]